MRPELVADANADGHLAETATQSSDGGPLDHGGQHVSQLFGTRLRDAGILRPMGSIGHCFDNSVAEAFVSGLQGELLDEHPSISREQWPINPHRPSPG